MQFVFHSGSRYQRLEWRGQRASRTSWELLGPGDAAQPEGCCDGDDDDNQPEGPYNDVVTRIKRVDMGLGRSYRNRDFIENVYPDIGSIK